MFPRPVCSGTDGSFEGLESIALHTTLRPLSVTHELHACDEVPDVLQAEPDGFHPGLAVTLSGQEAAHHGHATDHFIAPWRFLR